MINNENSIDSSYMFGTQRIVRQRMGKTKYDFQDWNSCMRQGYVESLRVMDLMGADYVNKNKTFIKFYCKKIKKEEIDL